MADDESNAEEFPKQKLTISMRFFGDIKLFQIFCFIVNNEMSVGWSCVCCTLMCDTFFE